MEHFKEYLPILGTIITIYTVAIFGFALPKFTDYFNDRPRTKLKDTLDIKKGLDAAGRPLGPEFDKIIDYYENEFVRAEIDFINSDEKSRNKKLGRNLDDIFRLVILIPMIGVVVYMIILGIVR